jgi:hypothetical protein
VVEVVMRQKDGIDALDPVCQGLLSEVWTRIDDQMDSAGFNVARTAEAPVLRIV